jgi:hypothetical protein
VNVADLWLAPVAAGLLLAAPLPRPRMLGALCRAALRLLAAPMAALLILFVLAHSGRVEHPGEPLRIALYAAYWATLAYAALSVCRVVARLYHGSVVPGARRLRASFVLVGTGTALIAAHDLLAAVPRVNSALALALVAATILRAAPSYRRE